MPKLQNLLVNPVVHVLADKTSGVGHGEATLEVEGLVCHLCAARVKQSLANVPGVTKVEFDSRNDAFRVCYQGGRPLGHQLTEAAQSMVVAPRVRRLLGFRKKGTRAVNPGPS